MKSIRDFYSKSRDVYDWMSGLDLSIGIAAEGENDLFFLGRHVDGSQSICSRAIDGCNKLCADEATIWASTRNHIWKFENCLHGIPTPIGCDRMFLSTLGISTGDLGVEDIVVEAHGRIVLASSSNGCLVTIRDTNCVVPFWRPPVGKALFDTERCRLSGLALDEGYSKYVTIFEKTMQADGLSSRSKRRGFVIDIDSNEIVANDLSMPRSPRIYNGLLWLLNAGTGHFGFVDLATGNFQDVLGIHGSLQSLTFHGDFAIVGISKPGKYNSKDRFNRAMGWNSSNDVAQCEMQVVDMRRGIATSRFVLPRGIHKINDIAVLPGVRMPGVVRPQAVGFNLDERDALLQVGSGEPWTQTIAT